MSSVDTNLNYAGPWEKIFSGDEQTKALSSANKEF